MSQRKRRPPASIPEHPRRWREFERLIARIHNQLYPGAAVRHNEYIVGTSGLKRQFDVAIRAKLGPHASLTVVDCKNHTTPVDIGLVEQFRVQADDVHADMAVLVSSSGFTAGAIAQGKVLNVRLMTFSEASALDWKSLFGRIFLKILDFTYENLKYRIIPTKGMSGIDFNDYNDAASPPQSIYVLPDMREIAIADVIGDQLFLISEKQRQPGQIQSEFELRPGSHLRVVKWTPLSRYRWRIPVSFRA